MITIENFRIKSQQKTPNLKYSLKFCYNTNYLKSKLSTMMNEKQKVNSEIIYFNKTGNNYDAAG